MPVLSEYDGVSSSCRHFLGGRFLLGIFGLVVCAVLVLQHRRRKLVMSTGMDSEKGEEKGVEYGDRDEKRGFEYDELTWASPPEKRNQQQQEQEQEQNQQSLESTNLTNIQNLSSIPSSPTYPPSPTTYTSTITSSTSTSTEALKLEIPRRRSYAKTITTSPEGNVEVGEIVEVNVSGEIIVSPEGWRRHTRVFGGGVCRACEESEKSRGMMGVSP